MQYFEVFKISSLKNHKGIELSPNLSFKTKERLLNKGFKETKNSFKIPLEELTKKKWKSILPLSA